MQTDSISMSSTISNDEITFARVAPSVTSSDAGSFEIHPSASDAAISQTDESIQNKEGITPHEFESNSMKQKILKFFCCT